ncbi:hypothetical protein PMY35_07410 [Clostridium tertium]|uniref:hypothetical protein n=1 Tax=Clostridium tertium TaxID=1559 RepID=UPI00189EC737|nr:hypothetical protein [Clostridium tertium]MDB1947646.1 hypothetical protein [Clostridium tertium]
MDLLYAAEIYLLTLLKMFYVLVIHVLSLLAVMALIRIITKDKAVFTKIILKLKEELYGVNIRHCK